MRARVVVALLAAATLIAMAPAASAHGQEAGGPPPGPGGPGRGPHMHGPLGPLGWALSRLELTAEQQQRIDALVAEARPALDELHTQLRAAEKAFRDANPLTSFDEAAIRAYAAARTKLDADLMVGEAKLRNAVAGLLTAEQLAQLEQLLSQSQVARGPGEPPHPAGHRPQ